MKMRENLEHLGTKRVKLTIYRNLLQIAIGALSKSCPKILGIPIIMEHFGDSILPYIYTKDETKFESPKENSTKLPIIVMSKIKYVNVKPSSHSHSERQNIFPHSSLRGPRREIR